MSKKSTTKEKQQKRIARVSRRKVAEVGDRVEVEWEDAYSGGGWQADPTKHFPAIVHTVGFIVFNDKRGVKLAMGHHQNEDGSYDALGQAFVPRGMVRKITKI